MEDREVAARHEVVDLALVRPQRGEVLRTIGRDDGVVVADLVVGDDATQRQRRKARHEVRRARVGAVRAADVADMIAEEYRWTLAELAQRGVQPL